MVRLGVGMSRAVLEFDKLAFSDWTAWTARSEIDGVNLPGVYLLGRFRSGVPGTVDAIAPEIIYIGETVNRTLTRRWYEFTRSAFEEKQGHSGGWSYRERVGTTPRWLHVAALPVNLEQPELGAYIRAVERALIWAYVDRHARMPVCNSK